MANKWWLAAAALGLSLLQAWDSNALDSEGSIKLLIAAGVALPALTIGLTRHGGLRLVAVAVGVVLLFVSRAVSNISMPELALAAVFPGIIGLLDNFVSLQKRTATRNGEA